MAHYAIGDLQGCYEPLMQLLELLRFDPARDRLLFTGDLVNRGPHSLEVLRYVRSLGDRAVTVLGNHDLHLLAAADSGKFGPRDTLDAIMRASDRDELLGWLRTRPLMHHDKATGVLLVHAGLPPQWTRRTALQLAREASECIAGRDGIRFLRRMYGNEPDRWSPSLRGNDRIRFIVNCCTRLRYCTREGRIDLRQKGPPGSQPQDLLPWFQVPGRRSASETILCGHWSALGQVHWPDARVWGLDTGCIWGRSLTALNVETGELHQASCSQFPKHDDD